MEVFLYGVGFIVPIGLVVLCCISWMQRRKIRKATLDEKRITIGLGIEMEMRK